MKFEGEFDNCLSRFATSTVMLSNWRVFVSNLKTLYLCMIFSQGDIWQQTAGMLLHPIILQTHPRHTRQVHRYGERRLRFLQGSSLSDGEQSGQSGLWNHLQHWGNNNYFYYLQYNQQLLFQLIIIIKVWNYRFWFRSKAVILKPCAVAHLPRAPREAVVVYLAQYNLNSCTLEMVLASEGWGLVRGQICGLLKMDALRMA